MKITDSKFLSKLTGRKLSAVEALLASPAADQALETAEAKVHSKRRELLAALADAGKPHQAGITAAAKAYTAALKRRIAAQDELTAALAEEAHTMQMQYGTQYSRDRAIAAIEGELLETADPRIKRFDAVLSSQDDTARAALSFYGKRVRTTGETGKGIAFDSNMSEVLAARGVIAECRAECAQLTQAPLGYDEVTAKLVAMCERLEKPLAGVNLNPAQIGDDGAVEAPMPWGARKGWRVETAIQQPRQQEPLPMAKPH